MRGLGRKADAEVAFRKVILLAPNSAEAKEARSTRNHGDATREIESIYQCGIHLKLHHACSFERFFGGEGGRGIGAGENEHRQNLWTLGQHDMRRGHARAAQRLDGCIRRKAHVGYTPQLDRFNAAIAACRTFRLSNGG